MFANAHSVCPRLHFAKVEQIPMQKSSCQDPKRACLSLQIMKIFQLIDFQIIEKWSIYGLSIMIAMALMLKTGLSYCYVLMEACRYETGLSQVPTISEACLGLFCLHSVVFFKKVTSLWNNICIFASCNTLKLNTMVRKYKNKEEMLAAFKFALEAREAFEKLVKGEIDVSEFESRGYKLMQTE